MLIEIDILSKHLDKETRCPLCYHPMYEIEGEIAGKIYQFYQCKSCQHQIYPHEDRVCYCNHCQQERKALIRQTLEQEQQHYTVNKEIEPVELLTIENLSFIQKLFLLSLLDYHVNEERTHGEYIKWDDLKYLPITPNYQYQKHMLKKMIKQNIILEQSEFLYLNLSIDGVYESSLYQIHQGLKSGFYKQLSEYIPFKHENEVYFALQQVMYQEIIQFMKYICGPWKIQIAGHQQLKQVCLQLMKNLSLTQIFYLIKNALEYLHQKKLLRKKNNDFVNTNLLRKTLTEYYDRINLEKWETGNIFRPQELPMSHMSQILYGHFLNLREHFDYQPLWKIWESVKPRLQFFSRRRCLYCGSPHIWVEYDQFNQISLKCQQCHRQMHYCITS